MRLWAFLAFQAQSETLFSSPGTWRKRTAVLSPVKGVDGSPVSISMTHTEGSNLLTDLSPLTKVAEADRIQSGREELTQFPRSEHIKNSLCWGQVGMGHAGS